MAAQQQTFTSLHFTRRIMLTYILVAIAIVGFAYVKRHGFRRAWYILRTDAENPD